MADTRTRKSKRSPVTLKIKFKSATIDQFIERYSVDVSHGGIFIRTKDPLPVGTTMRFEFQLKDASPLIQGEGTVVWTREHDPTRVGVAPGMGVRFGRLTEGSQQVLEKILRRKANKGSGSKAFSDAPTRVAPSPLVEDLARESKTRRPSEVAIETSTFDDERTDATPLPRPIPFHSDADDFPDEAFEEATKVRSVDDLVAMSARSGTDDEFELDGPVDASSRSDAVVSSAPYDYSEPTNKVRREDVEGPVEPILPIGSSPVAAPAAMPEEEPTMTAAPFMASVSPSAQLSAQLPAPLAASVDSLPRAPTPQPPVHASSPDGLEELLARQQEKRRAESGPPVTETSGQTTGEFQDVAAAEAQPEPGRIEVGDDGIVVPPAIAASASAGGKPRAIAADNEATARIPDVHRASTRRSRKNLALIVTAAAALLILLAGGGYALFLHGGGSEEGAGSEPTDQATSPGGERAPAGPDSDQLGAIADTAAADGSDPRAASKSAAALATGQTDAAAAAPPTPVKLVKVRLRSTPRGAMAEIIGTDQKGPTPVTFLVAQSQTYRVRFSTPGFLTREVTLNPQVLRPPPVKLELEPWIIRIRTTPAAARVYVDGRKVASKTPVDFEVPLDWRNKKRFKVALRKGGYDKLNVTVLTAEFQREPEGLFSYVDETMVKADAQADDPGRRPRGERGDDRAETLSGQGQPPGDQSEAGSSAADPSEAGSSGTESPDGSQDPSGDPSGQGAGSPGDDVGPDQITAGGDPSGAGNSTGTDNADADWAGTPGVQKPDDADKKDADKKDADKKDADKKDADKKDADKKTDQASDKNADNKDGDGEPTPDWAN